MQEAAERGGVDRVLEIRVAEHDQRIRAAELQHDPLQLAAARLRQATARLRRAREVEPPHGGVLDELVADPGRLAGRVRDDVQHAGRQARLGEDLAPERATGDRRPLRRLQHDRVAEHEGRRDRAQREDQRRVPGRDRADDARPAAGAPSPSLPECRTGSPLRRARRPSRPPGASSPGVKNIWNMPKPNVEPVSRASRSTTSSRRLSRMSAARRKIPWRTRGRRRSPGGERLGSGLDRASRVVARPGGRTNDRLAGERVGHVEGGAVARGDPLAADEVERLAEGCRRLCRLRHGLAPFEGQWRQVLERVGSAHLPSSARRGRLVDVTPLAFAPT